MTVLYSIFCNLIKMKNVRVYRLLVNFCLLCFLALSFAGCQKGNEPGSDQMGKRPLYLPLSALDGVKSMEPQSIENTGPIFLLDTLFFMTEMKKGIHVFNVKDSASIQNLTFFSIPAVTDFTIYNGFLYADSWTDLLTIDISNLQNIALITREEAVFEPLLYPPLYQGFFECVDLSLGAVVGWEDARLEKAKCTTFF